MLHWFKKLQQQKISTFVLVGLILISAAFLRLYRIADYMTFLGDEGRDVLVVYGILHGDLTLLGPTASVGGFFLGPIYYYFMAPFLWLFNYNPVGPAIMVGLFGVATVWLVYKLGSEFFGIATGIMAATLYSIAPLIIAYSRSSWNPNLMPFFSLLTLYVLYKAFIKNSWWLLILSGIFLGVTMQLHYLATFLGVIIIVYVVCMNVLHAESLKKFADFLSITKKTLIYGVLLFLGFVIGWFPLLLFELRHNFPNFTSIYKFIFQSNEAVGGGRYFEIIHDVTFRIFARLVTNYPPPEQVSVVDSSITISLIFTQFTVPVGVLFVFTIFLSSVSIGVFLLRTFQISSRKNKASRYLLLFIWFFVGVFLFGYYKKAIHDYYFGFMFPVPFLLVGHAFSYFWEKRTSYKVCATIVLLTLAILNLQGIPFRFPANRQLAQVEGIARTVYEKTEGKPYNFALTGVGNSDHAYRYFLTLWNKAPVKIEHTGNLGANPKTVTDQLLVICERPPCHPLGEAKWEIAGFGRAEIVGEWDVSVVKVYKLIHYEGKK